MVIREAEIASKVASKAAQTAADNSGTIVVVAVIGVLAAVQVAGKLPELADKAVDRAKVVTNDFIRGGFIDPFNKAVDDVKGFFQGGFIDPFNAAVDDVRGLVRVFDEDEVDFVGPTYDVDGVPVAVPVPVVDEDDGFIETIKGWF